MITTLTLNPCIDHTVEVAGIEIGGTNRINKVKRQVSGKGINVSIALAQLGIETCGLIFSHEKESEPVAATLEKMGIRCGCVSVPGELRTNIKVFDSVGKEMTEFNEKGSPVPEGAAEEMFSLIKNHLDCTDILVVTGSVPPGIPADFYRRVIELAKEKGVLTILDADNELLREGIEAKPTMVKPNIGELERYLGRKLNSEQEIIAAASELVKAGIEYVCVSVGAEGAYLICKDGAYHTKGAEIEVRGIQGAGDSLVAGFAIGLTETRTSEDCLRLAVACADASLIREGTEMCRKEDVERLLSEIRIRKL